MLCCITSISHLLHHQVNKLELQDNELSAIPDILLSLPCLNKLNLCNNNLTSLPELPQWSPSLTQLNLSQNRLTNIPGEPKAPKLRNLYLSRNDFTAVPQCISSFANLEILDLSENKGIQVLPDEMGLLEKLQTLNLTGLKLKDPPEQYRKSAKDLVAYLKSKLRKAKPFYSMKLMLVGRENRGKTTLVARLQGRDYRNQSTVGVDISEWECDEGPNVFYFSIWDFAGQEEYYATHQCFLSNCSIYLLLFNLKDGQAAFSEMEPWLGNIALRARGSCVHIVGTHLDEVSQDERSTIDGLLGDIRNRAETYMKGIEVHAVSLKAPMENIDKLKKSIYKSASEYTVNGELVMGQIIPDSYHKLYHYFKKGMAADSKRKTRDPVMVREEFIVFVEQICGCTLDQKELKRVTQFLIDTGVLLHYDDHSHNLDELYFIDPRWLCDMMSSIVTVREKNPYVKDGILLLSNIHLVLRDERFQSHHFGQYLTLLDRFEIAFALDNQRVLVPSLLPEVPPADIYNKWSGQLMYTRYIALDVQTIAPGFWSRMLSRIMHSVPQLQSAISMTSDHLEGSNAKMTVMSTADRFLSSVSLPHTFTNVSQVTLTYWKSGILYQDPDVLFGVWSLKHVPSFDRQGIFVTASHNTSGKKLFCQLVDLAMTLCDNEFQGGDANKHLAPCPKCIQNGAARPDLMDIHACWMLLDESKNSVTCKGNHTIPLVDILPDLLLSDMSPRFYVRNVEDLCCDDQLLGKGGEACVYSGTYKGQPVAIKKYTDFAARNEEHFRHLRNEILLFQRLYHPCLVNLIAVSLHPTIDVVLERAPLGSLQECLITKQEPVHRIVVHRIAAQVAAALRAIHNLGVIHRDLKAGNVLVWSLDPESLCHCKLTDFGTAVEQAPIGTREKTRGTKGFTSPEALGRSGRNYIYNHMSDIFSFAMLLYQMIARREPYNEVKEVMRNDIIIKGERPRLQDIPQAETAYFYLTRLMQLCWQEEPSQRPTTTEIVIKASLSSMQSILCVLPIPNGLELLPSCVVSQAELVRSGMASGSSEFWICTADKNEGTEIDVYPIATMKSRVHLSIQSTVGSIVACGSTVWVSSKSGFDDNRIQVFDIQTGTQIGKIPMHEYVVSCMAASDQVAYCGTTNGTCFMFIRDMHTTAPTFRPVMNKISGYGIDCIVVAPDFLWVSNAHNIHLLDPSTMAVQGAVTNATEITQKRQGSISQQQRPRYKRTLSNSVLDRRLKKAQIGQMKMSSDRSTIWSSHLDNSICVLAWNVSLREMRFSLYIDEHMKRATLCSEQGMIITAIAPALDTLWIGTKSGYILVVRDEQLLSWFHPYLEHVCFLECVPCGQTEEHMVVISGGKSFKSPIPDINAYKEKNQEGESVDTAGTVVVWEAFPSRLVSQVQLVQDESYTYLDDHDTVRKVIQIGNFKDTTHLTD